MDGETGETGDVLKEGVPHPPKNALGRSLKSSDVRLAADTSVEDGLFERRKKKTEACVGQDVAIVGTV